MAICFTRDSDLGSRDSVVTCVVKPPATRKGILSEAGPVLMTKHLTGKSGVVALG